MMKVLNTALAGSVLTLLAMPASAALMATATINATPMGAGNYQYDLTLSDTGTTTIGTLWFGWKPGANFLSVTPTNASAPAGWTANVVNAVGSSSIQWVAGSGALSSGNSLSGFSFQSTETPAELMGAAAAPNQADPVTTSFVYSGAPFSDSGYQLTASVSSVPLPASAWLFASSLVGMFGLKRKYRVAS